MARPKFSLNSEYWVLALCGLYILGVAPFTPGFATPGNFANILASLLPLFVVAMGQTVVLITGGIDLSQTSIMALVSVTGAAIMSSDGGWLAANPLAVPAAIVAMLLLGAFLGLLNGVAVARLRMPPFIVTLVAMTFLSGLAIWLTKSKNIGGLPAGFILLGGNPFCAFAIAALLAVTAHLLLSRTLWGAWLYAVGQNPKAAIVSGVPYHGVVVSAYVLSGGFAAVATVLYMGQSETGSPVLGQKILLDVIGATVIGGTSLWGGKGKILWTLYGVLFIKLLDNSLNLLDLSYFSIMMVKGSVILLAALLDSVRNKTLLA
jgi:ribose transport system permease protein